MATSVLMASDDHDNTRVEMKLSGPENGKRCGRKKSKPIDHGTQQKKKPQRGMGVAQLERLRLQDHPFQRWKKMTEINPNLHPLSQQNHPFQFGDPTPTRFGNFGAMNGSGLNQAPLYLQRLGNDGFLGAMPTSGAGIVFPDHFPVDPYRVGASNPTSWASGNVNMIPDTSKELSSVPNMKCFSEHCGVCHKKKRLNGETLGCNGVSREVYPEIPRSYSCGNLMGLMNAGNKCNINGQNQHVFSTKLPIYQSYADGKIELQEAEVRAVHRNGDSGGSGSSSNVVMEYDFFPGKSSSTCFEEWISLGSESSSSVAVGGLGGSASCLTTTTNTSTAVFGASSTSAIDLSLKLSY